MTADLLIILFKQEMNRSDSAHSQAYEVEEIELMLNNHQDIRLSQLIRDAETDQKVQDDLRMLLFPKQTLVFASSGTRQNFPEYIATLPADYRHRSRCYSSVTCDGTAIDTKYHKVASHNDVDKLLYNSFNKPTLHKAVVLYAKNFLYIYTDPNVTLTDVKLDYYQKPTPISVAGNFPNNDPTTDLPDYFYQEVVKLAAKNAMKDASDQRYPAQQNEVNKME